MLPAEVARDVERLARFKREAHLLASLNHPNIAAIYGLEEADGQPFLALELVEGQDLKQRLEEGALHVDTAASRPSSRSPLSSARDHRALPGLSGEFAWKGARRKLAPGEQSFRVP